MAFEPFRRVVLRFEEEAYAPKGKRKVGRIRMSYKHPTMAVVFVAEQYVGQIYLSDLKSLLDERKEAGIFQFNSRRK